MCSPELPCDWQLGGKRGFWIAEMKIIWTENVALIRYETTPTICHDLHFPHQCYIRRQIQCVYSSPPRSFKKSTRLEEVPDPELQYSKYVKVAVMTCHLAKSSDDEAIPAHQLWEAFVEVMCCTQGNGWGGQDLLHYLCHHLLPFRKSCSTGLWAPEPGFAPLVQFLQQCLEECDLDQPALRPLLFWSQLYHHMQCKQPGRAPGQLESAGMGREYKGANKNSRGLP